MQYNMALAALSIRYKVQRYCEFKRLNLLIVMVLTHFLGSTPRVQTGRVASRSFDILKHAGLA